MGHPAAAHVFFLTFSYILSFCEWGVLEDSFLSMGHPAAAHVFLLTFSYILSFCQ